MSFLRLGRLIAKSFTSAKKGKRVIKDVEKHFQDPTNVAILAGEIAVGVAAETTLDHIMKDDEVDVKKKKKNKTPKV